MTENRWLYPLATLLLAPLLFVQGRTVRRRIPRLPEAQGARRGVYGAGSLLRLLIVGDSAAAGVGVSHQREALAGRLVEQLSSHYTVHWQLEARTGATTQSTLQYLEKLDAENFDIAITSLGVNDVTSRLSRDQFRTSQNALRELLRFRFGVRHIIVSGLPPLHGFPALPQPLRWWLGDLAHRLDEVLQRDLADEPDTTFLSLRFTDDASLMAMDGFHPGPQVYREWARRASIAVVECSQKLDNGCSTGQNDFPSTASRDGELAQ